MREPDWQTADGAIRLWHGDCRDYLDDLRGEVDCVVTDPPYGVDNDCDYTRFSGGLAPHHHHHGIYGDNEPFDPSPLLSFREVVLFGWQFFADKTPPGTTLVWNKKAANQLGTFLSDCEIAWMKGGCGSYLFNHIWHGFDRQTERGDVVLHPSQKPVALFEWVLSKVKSSIVLDPYFGSCACGVACVRLGRRFIGIERERKYFDIAVDRITKELNRMRLFEPPPKIISRALPGMEELT